MSEIIFTRYYDTCKGLWIWFQLFDTDISFISYMTYFFEIVLPSLYSVSDAGHHVFLQCVCYFQAPAPLSIWV